MAVVREGVDISPDIRDQDAFAAFYDEALPVVYGYFLRRTGSEQSIAEDLTQETFLGAAEQVAKGVRVLEPMPWIIGIARHRLVDHYRSAERRRSLIFDSDLDDIGSDDGDSMVEIVDRDFAIAALDRLPEYQRLCLSLRYLDGMSVPEIALFIDRSVHATESLLARGRKSFKRHYLELDNA